jgi:hypothetical protein
VAVSSSRGGEKTRNRAGKDVPATRRPSITIVKPRDGATLHNGAVTVSVSVKGFRLVEQRVRPPFPRRVAGVGHVHFYLDAGRLPKTHTYPSTVVYRSISATSYTWTGVAAGKHSFAVQLVGKDHVPLSRRVTDRVTVTVE